MYRNLTLLLEMLLLDAGAEIVGKSVCEYFSFSGGAATSYTGPVHNPRAWGHTPGGSSTGSGALVALGEVGHGDGWRSGRIHPYSGLIVRSGWHQANLGPRALYRHHGNGSNHRSRGTVDGNDLRECAVSGSDGRTGRARLYVRTATRSPTIPRHSASRSRGSKLEL